MKLDLNLAKKPEKTEEISGTPAIDHELQNEEPAKTNFDFEAQPPVEPAMSPDSNFIDWRMIGKVSHGQFALSIICSTCLLMSLSFTGFNFLRFTSSAWATYILCTAYVGLRAARLRNYAHLVAYTGMVCFQTVVYMSSLCWLVYSLYALDYHLYMMRSGGFCGFSGCLDGHLPNLSLFLVLGEVSTLMGTVFTGVFGLLTCCRGFGRMMEHFDQMITESRYVPQPQITVRPLV